MSYAIYEDWTSENRFEKWENETISILRQIIEDEEHPKFKEVCKSLSLLDDKNKLVEYWEENLNDFEPIYNYVYPLETTPSEENILKVALNTNCCVMYNTENDKYYLSLTGCGMDLSQDIALSYVIIESWIPEDLLFNICSQEGLSISKESFKVLKEGIKKNIKKLEFNTKLLKESWKL